MPTSTIEDRQLKPDLVTRRRNGVVYTPSKVADALTDFALLSCKIANPTILEPSAGDGAFMSSLRRHSVDETRITAVDIDQQAATALSMGFDKSNVVHSDFLSLSTQFEKTPFDLIIGNPPYIRRHNFQEDFNQEIKALGERCEYPIAQLKNAWAAFTLASSRILSPKGVLAFIVPYELMNVKYGQYLQKHVLEQFSRVDIFIPDEKAFRDLDQDAVAFVATKDSAQKTGIHVHRVASLSDLSIVSSKTIDHKQTSNLSIDLKSFLLDSQTTELLHKLRLNLKTVYDYCDSSAGIVTAANDYFILKAGDVERLKLKPWAREILKKGSFLPDGPIFSRQHFVELAKREPCYLIDFQRIDRTPLAVDAIAYIKQGEEQEFHQRYKCKNRSPWHRVPIVPASDGFFFKRSHSFPRLCINEAKILATDTAYQVKMHDGYSIKSLCFSFYNSLTILFSEIDGRFYGGGVLELTPSEFKGLPLVYSEPSNNEFSEFLDKFPTTAGYQGEPFALGDGFLKLKMQLSEDDMEKILGALTTIRSHRLRHGVSKLSN